MNEPQINPAPDGTSGVTLDLHSLDNTAGLPNIGHGSHSIMAGLRQKGMRRLRAWRDFRRVNPDRLADDPTPVHGRFRRSRFRPGVYAG